MRGTQKPARAIVAVERVEESLKFVKSFCKVYEASCYSQLGHEKHLNIGYRGCKPFPLLRTGEASLGIERAY